MKWLKTLIWMVIFIIAILFSIQNNDEVTLRFGLSPIQDVQWLELPPVPLFLPILCSVFLGVLISTTSDFFRRLQLKRTLRHHKKTIERLETEIESLRRSTAEDSSIRSRNSNL